MKRPNLLLVMTDQQRADSVFGPGTDDTTPNLGALGRRGVVFENAYSASTTCVPARSALLTGLFDQRLPRGPDGRALQDGYWNVAHALAGHGYQTALIGKMHFSPLHAQQGFQLRRSCEHLTIHAGYSPNDVDDYRRWMASQGLVDRRFEPREDHRFPYDARLHPTAWVTGEAIQFLEKRDRSRPYFAVVSYPSPHSPLDPPKEYAALCDPASQPIPKDRMEDNLGLPPTFASAFRGAETDFFSTRTVADQPPGSVAVELAAIRALIRHIDDAIAELMEHVSLDDTVVFFTSDHGDYGGHRGLLGKVPWIPFDDLAKVPLCCLGSGVEGGRRVTAPVQSCDIALTCLDLAGMEPPYASLYFDSESLARVLRGGEQDPGRAVFCAFSMGWPMIRRGPLKYIWHWGGDRVLFDLDADPAETRNIVHEHTAVVSELAIHLKLQMDRPMLDLPVQPAP